MLNDLIDCKKTLFGLFFCIIYISFLLSFCYSFINVLFLMASKNLSANIIAIKALRRFRSA